MTVKDHDNTTTATATATPSSDTATATASDTVTSSRAVDESNMKWRYQHTIDPAAGDVRACQMISPNQLAVCVRHCVKVYDVTGESSRLAYTVATQEWRMRGIHGVAVSESSPDSMLVICDGLPYVYQCPRHESTVENKKFEIQSNDKNPWCIVANASVAVIAMSRRSSFIVWNLPDFTHQSHVQIGLDPSDMTITSDYLVVASGKVMIVKALSDVTQDVARIESPDGGEFSSIAFRNNGREIYAACNQVETCCVYKYTWDGVGKPEYVNSGSIFEYDIMRVYYRVLSVTSGRLLAVGQYMDGIVLIYKLH
ncbi:uncharacterized protein [Amphiura filiformis]|uniref:uncharacterized protein n=1 Tax=Amphiura filiformis TaxID=82378 RepID=UPI003B21E2C3